MGDEIHRKGDGQGIEGTVGEGQRLSAASAKGDRQVFSPELPLGDTYHVRRKLKTEGTVARLSQVYEQAARAESDFQHALACQARHSRALPAAPLPQGDNLAHHVIHPGQLIVEKVKAETDQPPWQPHLCFKTLKLTNSIPSFSIVSHTLGSVRTASSRSLSPT